MTRGGIGEPGAKGTARDGRDARGTGLVGVVGFGAGGFRDPFDFCERRFVVEAFDAAALGRGVTDLLI